MEKENKIIIDTISEILKSKHTNETKLTFVIRTLCKDDKEKMKSVAEILKLTNYDANYLIHQFNDVLKKEKTDDGKISMMINFIINL
jgi:DNA-binding ferritin-like protein